MKAFILHTYGLDFVDSFALNFVPNTAVTGKTRNKYMDDIFMISS